jgi:hypothetical protein
MSSKDALWMLIYALQSGEIEPWLKASAVVACFGVFVIAAALKRGGGGA